MAVVTMVTIRWKDSLRSITIVSSPARGVIKNSTYTSGVALRSGTSARRTQVSSGVRSQAQGDGPIARGHTHVKAKGARVITIGDREITSHVLPNIGLTTEAGGILELAASMRASVVYGVSFSLNRFG